MDSDVEGSSHNFQNLFNDDKAMTLIHIFYYYSELCKRAYYWRYQTYTKYTNHIKYSNKYHIVYKIKYIIDNNYTHRNFYKLT